MYDEARHLLGEYTSAGTLIQETAWLNEQPVATLRPNGAGISLYYIHADQLNTPRTITRPADTVALWRWDTDPYGTAAESESEQPVLTGSFACRRCQDRVPAGDFFCFDGEHFGERSSSFANKYQTIAML